MMSLERARVRDTVTLSWASSPNNDLVNFRKSKKSINSPYYFF